MPYKVCPHCGETSYSSSELGVWICPKCKIDLTNIKATVTNKK